MAGLNPWVAILISGVVGVIIYLLARHNKIRPWSSVILALLVFNLVLAFTYPKDQNFSLYMFISIIISVIILIYVLGKALSDREFDPST